MYQIFTRNWYKVDGHTPNPGARKTYIKVVETEEEAHDYCTEANDNRPASWLKRSKKFEFMRI